MNRHAPYKDREERLAYYAAHYAAHREERLAYQRAYYAAHRETIREQRRASPPPLPPMTEPAPDEQEAIHD